jgi:hypothetical protein
MLDCETPRGMLFIEDQYQTQRILAKRGFTVINTRAKDHHSDIYLSKEIDGVLTMYGVAEIKSRMLAGPEKITAEYVKKNGYLVTAAKLQAGAKLSAINRVPFFLIVNLLLDNKLLVWEITDSEGNYNIDLNIKSTSTQKTCNGGSVIRDNAYLPYNTKYLTEIEYQ